MKKEAVSPFVTRVTFGSRTRSRPNLHYPYHIQFYSIYYTILQCLIHNLIVSPSNFVVSAFFITKLCSVRFLALQNFIVSSFFVIKVCNIRFFMKKLCSISLLRLQKFVESISSENKCVYWYLVMSLIQMRYMGMQFNVSHEFSLSNSPSIIQPLYPSFNDVQECP